MSAELSVAPSGPIIVARVRGEPTVALLRECQQQVLSLAREASCTRVLYDALEMTPPAIDVPWSQRQLDEQLEAGQLRRAIVVPTTRLAFLARLAFGAGDYRVFYSDLRLAEHWLVAPSDFDLKRVR